MLNVIFTFNFFEVYIAMDDSKDPLLCLVLSIVHGIHHMLYWFFKTGFKTIYKILVQ